MSWFGGGRRRGVWRRGALALVAAAVTLLCVAAGVTLADVGLSGASAGASAPVGTGTSRSGKTSERLRRTAHSQSVGLAGSSHASVSSASVLGGLPLAPAEASFADLMGTDAITNAANHSVGATTAAVDPLDCSTATVYSIGSGAGGSNPQGLYSLATAGLDGASVPATLVAAATGSTTSGINALGITANGTAAYWVNKSDGHVYEYSAATGVVTDRGASGLTGTNLSSLVAGAVNPANGFFYYSYASTTGTMVLYAFNTNTNVLVGQVATASAPLFSNGDIAFDGGGNLYWVGSSRTTAALGVIPGPIPTTASTTATLVGKEITTYPDPTSAQFDGIAFDSAGNLYLQELASGTTSLLRVNPLTGVSNGGPTAVSPAIGGTDLGTCATTPSLGLQKNLVGRIQPSDQFTLAITGPGISGSTTGATATTSGTSTGIQSEQAGPLPVISGNTYTLTETATNNNLSSYTSSYSCTSSAGGTVASGAGTSFTLTVPTPGTGQTGPAIACVFTNTPLTSSLSIVKSVTAPPPPASVNAVGQTVTYHYTVTNTGQTPLTAVHVTDTQEPPAGSLASGPTCQSLSTPTGTCSGSSTSLAVGQSASFTATYVVTQADLNNGSINDSATATGSPPSGPAVTSPPSTATVPVTQSPALSIVKSVTAPPPPASVNAVGQTVTYTFAVKNTGNVSLTAVHVTDTQEPPAGSLASGPTCESLSSPTGTCSGSSTSLVPGQSATFTATYVVTQADLNNGSINDSATATGSPPSGPAVTSPPSTATVPVTQSPALSIVKSVTAPPPPASVNAVGQTVTYHFTVTNTGNVGLTAVHVTDTQEPPAGGLASGPTCQSLSSPTGTCSGSSTSLVPGQVGDVHGDLRGDAGGSQQRVDQ